jgi:hypothetical protein
MPRESNIPKHLHSALFERWMLGESLTQLARWIDAGNADRMEAVRTSRSSVNRLIERLVADNTAQRQVAAVNRARSRSPEIQERLERVERDLQRCLKAAGAVDGSAAARERVVLRLRTLSQMSVHLHRQFRAVGLNGSAPADLLEDHSYALAKMREHVKADNLARLEAEGEPEKSFRFEATIASETSPKEAERAEPPLPTEAERTASTSEEPLAHLDVRDVDLVEDVARPGVAAARVEGLGDELRVEHRHTKASRAALRLQRLNHLAAEAGAAADRLHGHPPDAGEVGRPAGMGQ